MAATPTPGSAGAAAGTLDPSFGSAGVVVAPNSVRSVITATPGGGFVIAYDAPYGTSDYPGWVIRRYTADGDPRRGFGDGGKVRVAGSDEGDNDVREVRIDDRGRILLAGNHYAGPGTASARMVRLLEDGRRDGSFGGRGIVHVDVEPFMSEYVAGMVIQPSGRIVVGGSYRIGPQPRDTAVYLAGLTRAGELDPTFGDSGIKRTRLGKRSHINDLEMTPTGRPVGAGFVKRGDQLAVARWRVNGSLDRSFGDRGVVRTTIGAVAFATRVAVAPDGAIIVGASRPENDAGPALLRLRVDGSIDLSFGDGGVADLGGELFGSVEALTVQPDGKSIAAHETSSSDDDILLTRLDVNGLPDPSFGTDGVATIDLGEDDRVWSTALDRAGRLLVTAEASPRHVRRAVVLRVLT